MKFLETVTDVYYISITRTWFLPIPTNHFFWTRRRQSVNPPIFGLYTRQANLVLFGQTTFYQITINNHFFSTYFFWCLKGIVLGNLWKLHINSYKQLFCARNCSSSAALWSPRSAAWSRSCYSCARPRLRRPKRSVGWAFWAPRSGSSRRRSRPWKWRTPNCSWLQDLQKPELGMDDVFFLKKTYGRIGMGSFMDVYPWVIDVVGVYYSTPITRYSF